VIGGGWLGCGATHRVFADLLASFLVVGGLLPGLFLVFRRW
jgi:hypothetical protein